MQQPQEFSASVKVSKNKPKKLLSIENTKLENENLEKFFKAIQQADFSILEEETSHTGLREIQKIANSTNATQQRIGFGFIYKIVYDRCHGIRNDLSNYQFLGNRGRNPIVGHLYSRILNIGGNCPSNIMDLRVHCSDAETEWSLFNSILGLPNFKEQEADLYNWDAVISQCFRKTKQTIYKELATNIGQYDGLSLGFDEENFSKKWKNLTDKADSLAKGGTSCSASDHTGFGLLHRALVQYSANVTKFPLQIKDTYTLVKAQQKREAIQLLKKRLNEIDNGMLKWIASEATNKKIKALKDIISALADDFDDRPVKSILDSLLWNDPNLGFHLNESRVFEKNETETKLLITELQGWDNLESFEFLGNTEVKQGFINQLHWYKDQREKESDFISYFFEDYRFSKKIKIEAVKNLISHLNSGSSMLSGPQLKALAEGRLGSIVAQMQEKLPEYVPDSLKQELMRNSSSLA